MATEGRILDTRGILGGRMDAGTQSRSFHAVTRFLRTKPLGSVGAVIVLTIILLAIFAPLVAPYGIDRRVIAERMQNPSLHHILGTDELGRDIFSRVIHGARVSAFVGFGSVLLATVIAAAL